MRGERHIAEFAFLWPNFLKERFDTETLGVLDPCFVIAEPDRQYL